MRRLALLTLTFLLLSACRVPDPCATETGCVLIPADEAITLGVLHTWLGERASAGEQMLAGVRRAVEEHNSAGHELLRLYSFLPPVEERDTLLGHEIVLHRAGSECDEESARLAATALLTDAEVFLVIGPTCAEEINAIAPLFKDAGVFLVTPPAGEEAAYRLTMQILDVLARTAIRGRDGTLYLPRRDLQRELRALP